MILSWKIVRLKLKETFSIAYGNYSFRDALIISLKHNNYTGYGECTAIDYYSINLQDFTALLETHKAKIENTTIQSPFEFYAFLQSLLLPSFLQSALDCAYWDLFGKIENKSFGTINSISLAAIPNSSLTISIGSVNDQIMKISSSKWQKFKIKCNQFNQDTAIKLLDLDKDIALDANGSFSEENCQWLQNNLLGSKFLYVEQPLAVGQENYCILKCNSFTNWMADEDCHTIHDLKKLQSHYTAVNIKLVKCGGLTPALALLTEARKLNFKVMIGCMTESTIGISAAAALAPLCDFADLDGANLIGNDIAYGSLVVNGRINLSEKPGLGVQLI